MGNIGTSEILVVLLIALLVLGPTRLPSAARQVGKAMAEFRKVTSGLQSEMRDAISEFEAEVTVDDSPPSFPVGVDPAAAPGNDALPPASVTAASPPPPAESAWVFPDMTPVNPSPVPPSPPTTETAPTTPAVPVTVSEPVRTEPES